MSKLFAQCGTRQKHDLRYTAELLGMHTLRFFPSVSLGYEGNFWVAGSGSRQSREGRGCLRHR